MSWVIVLVLAVALVLAVFLRAKGSTATIDPRAPSLTNHHAENPERSATRVLYDLAHGGCESAPLGHVMYDLGKLDFAQLSASTSAALLDAYLKWFDLALRAEISRNGISTMLEDVIKGLANSSISSSAALATRLPSLAAALSKQEMPWQKNWGVNAKYAARILMTMGTEQAVDVLANALEDPQVKARGWVVSALGGIGTIATSKFPVFDVPPFTSQLLFGAGPTGQSAFKDPAIHRRRAKGLFLKHVGKCNYSHNALYLCIEALERTDTPEAILPIIDMLDKLDAGNVDQSPQTRRLVECLEKLLKLHGPEIPTDTLTILARLQVKCARFGSSTMDIKQEDEAAKVRELAEGELARRTNTTVS
jgi:hypothetical protein